VNGRLFVAVSPGTTLTRGPRLNLTPELRPSSGNGLFVFARPEAG
jgi:hypothetical protein